MLKGDEGIDWNGHSPADGLDGLLLRLGTLLLLAVGGREEELASASRQGEDLLEEGLLGLRRIDVWHLPNKWAPSYRRWSSALLLRVWRLLKWRGGTIN